MKNLIMLLVLFIPFTFFAQDRVEIKSSKVDDQTLEWMTKISADSELRVRTLEMMLDQTKGNEAEMTKLMNTMMANPEMHKMMMAMHSEKNGTQINSVEPRGMNSNNIKAGEMSKTEPVIKK